MAAKLMKVGAAAVVVTLGAYWYWSPFVAIHSMRSAAEKKDSDSFNEYVDYAKVRESLKGQFSAMMTEKLASTSSGSDMERAGSVLGSALAFAMVDKVVDGMVRPETVMRVMNEAKIAPKLTEQPVGQAQDGQKREPVRWAYDRKSVDKLIAYVADEPEGKRVSLVFERAGTFGWKLTEVRLPLAGK